MPDIDQHHLTPLNIRDGFPPVTTAQWEALIQADLKGADYDKRLVWKTRKASPSVPTPLRRHLARRYRARRIPFHPRQGRRLDHRRRGLCSANSIDASRFHESGATAVQELACAIAEASTVLPPPPIPPPKRLR